MADTNAARPSTAIASPLAVLITRTARALIRVRRQDPRAATTHHQASDPSSTPRTSSEGRRYPPVIPALRVAASAAKETMVAGLVMVRPSVDPYANARPPPLADGASVVFGLARAMRRPSTTSSAPPARASQ